MTVSIKIAALVAALGLAGPALAQTPPPAQSRSLAPQGGGIAIPNTFDAPATAAPVAPAPAAPQVTDAQMAEAALRSVIDQFRAADIDERLFTPGVATQLNSQLASYSRLIQGYGEVVSIEPQGATDGVGQFLVIFDNAATQWQVGLEDGGLVAALRFREAPPESSEPATPGA